MRTILAAALALIVAGCSANAPGSGTLVQITTQDGPRGGSACSGLTTIEGTLAGNGDRVFTAAAGASSGGVGIAWPNGYAARQAGSVIELMNQDGHVVARVGDRVRIAVTDRIGGRWFACRDTPAVVSP